MDLKWELRELERAIERCESKTDKLKVTAKMMAIMAEAQSDSADVPPDIFEDVTSDFRKLAVNGLCFLIMQQLEEL